MQMSCVFEKKITGAWEPLDTNEFRLKTYQEQYCSAILENFKVHPNIIKAPDGSAKKIR
jgi:hypothetical protein